MYETFINLVRKLRLVTYARFILSHNKLAYRIWFRVKISRYRRKEVLLKYIIEQSPKGSVIYDIGTHEGLYSIVLAQLIPNSVIYSFEPNPYVYSLLEQNVKTAGLEKRITLLNLALSSKNEMSDLFISSEPALSSLHMYNASFFSTITGSIKVKCVAVDYLIDNDICKPPDIIKIDTEGHEYEIILGAQKTIAKFRPAIGFEPHGIDGQAITTQEPIEKLLLSQGYTIKSLGYPIWCQVNK